MSTLLVGDLDGMKTTQGRMTSRRVEEEVGGSMHSVTSFSSFTVVQTRGSASLNVSSVVKIDFQNKSYVCL